MKLTDTALLKKIKSGDRPAFTLLYDRYWDSLYRFVFVRTRDKEVSEELLQDLWMKIIENTDAIQTDESESAKGYLLRHLHYRIIDYYNSYKKAPPILSIDEIDFPLETDLTDTEYFEILEENEISTLLSMIDNVVSQLPSTEQQVYDMRIRRNMSVNETAEALGISNKTVSNKLSKALGEIREKLNPEYQSSKKLVSILMLMEVLTIY
ncbi:MULTISPECIES: RNA polymerase sigma factor [Chryseobacterium]|jgi:RNA polymerase sigma factor, sigma-70 family|uniref:RNA polymerase sigma-70 factor (ECF subfamily) n=1 Tax=Chryseobacterium rhizosphaerae TaxID=395937 RepID=A0AAE3Y593_9FLAO|nr:MULTISPECIES: sigma-70 family RNA polymerase sigma factor [Chryseobacterium]MBL3547958.1 sigma-70 family RNA polymerase sigma factor [Chryseobacterium sp. KMC2]MDC8100643.1 sigma-70 family RNA polymerase sigma factor [Chryseobacterium rhizosphaerae]MDR6525643.1 RNA polymerase sigma-70 factor (ECF subfamily) [Chryseobacterium rhizosphaerae]MDR6545148.1 RNA polymerase sigma-70 factor (ECF subfamily) [Chryseobacterium rhizosphaerae]REC73135.1 sigma-70 family RNA polymerase sigma factor [Chryse